MSKNYDNLGKCEICKKIYRKQEHTGNGKGGFVHWYCLFQKEYLENMKELPVMIN